MNFTPHSTIVEICATIFDISLKNFVSTRGLTVVRYSRNVENQIKKKYITSITSKIKFKFQDHFKFFFKN